MSRVMRRTVTDRNPCMERGLIVYPGHGTVAGSLGDHLLIGPPLVITAGQVDDLLATLAEAIAAVEMAVGN